MLEFYSGDPVALTYRYHKILLSIVGDTTLARHITEVNNAKINRAGVLLRDALQKKVSRIFSAE